MTIQIKSYNQILGEMIRKIVADTPLNDINAGSTLLTLLEAAAQVDFENNASILNVLELLNVDAIRNNDLDARASDYGIVRIPAQRATGAVTISDTNISKRSSGLYQIKPAPIAGSTKLFVNNAEGWDNEGGKIFIGRGTSNFEGPISYTSIDDNGSFYTINLASSLEKDHLLSESVVDSQGTSNRLISAGTVVQIPANNLNPAVEYRILRDAVIPAGEDSVSDVQIVAIVAGKKSNAGIDTIVEFSSPPFSGAAVTNTTALTNGTDVETDNELRERVKSYASTLARGTKSAVLSAIIGVSDPEDGKQVASAVITEPTKAGDPSLLYIDDGSGFEPSFEGQSVDVLINSASGEEEFLQLSNFPLPRPQVINVEDGPYELLDNMEMRVLVDGIEELIIFRQEDFVNITDATISEVILAINSQSESFKATFTSNSRRILLFPLDHTVETIKVQEPLATQDANLYANNSLKFPTNEFSYIRLYQNNRLLTEKQQSATLVSSDYGVWGINEAGTLIIQVDGTPVQERGFDVTDFGGATFDALELNDWVEVFNLKFAGITASATSSGKLQIKSNRIGTDSSLEIVGGSYFNQMFLNQVVKTTGKNSDFQLNRQNGNIRILSDINVGDSISAGISDAKGSIISNSTPSGAYNVSVDENGVSSEIVIIADSPVVKVRSGIALSPDDEIVVADRGNNVMRLTAPSIYSFAGCIPGDFLFIKNRGILSNWIKPENCGLFKIIRKGEHTADEIDSYIEVKCRDIVPGTYILTAPNDLQFFKASTYPQMWDSSLISTPESVSITDLKNSINDETANISAKIYKTSSIKLTSTSEEDGSIAIPAGSGSILNVFSITDSQQLGTEGFIASSVSDKDFTAFYKRTKPTKENAENTAGKKIWLNRYQYTDINGTFDKTVSPGLINVDTYSEELSSADTLNSANILPDDIINFTDADNKFHYKSIRDILTDKVGTQFSIPRTVFDVFKDDSFNVMRPLGISSNDNIIFIIDQDAVNQMIDIPMYRTGQINSNFIPTNLSFSADDADNEPGINFGTLQVWGKNTNNTEFKDYSIWFQARNWYAHQGANQGLGSMILRSREYGPHGEKIRFNIEYPAIAGLDPQITHDNDADFTLATYKFGSSPAKSTGITDGQNFSVIDQGQNIYRYSFSNTVSLATILPGDILSINPGSGVSSSNSGQLRILAVDDLSKTVDVYNPSGSDTFIGNPEITTVNTIDDIYGSQTVSTISIILPAANLNGTYFVLEDPNGLVAVYYNVGSPSPGAANLGVSRVLEVTLDGTELNATVAAITAGIIASDPEFTAVSETGSVTITGLSEGGFVSSGINSSLTVTNATNGTFSPAVDGAVPTGFNFTGEEGSNDITIDGKYFILPSQNGNVAVWYDISGATPEPLHGADSSIEISTVNFGDLSTEIATKTAVVLTASPLFASATVNSNQITITDAYNSERSEASAGNSGFNVARLTAGVSDQPETIISSSKLSFFSLVGTTTGEITEKISESPIIYAVTEDPAGEIPMSTSDENYVPAGVDDYSQSLAFGHVPDPGSSDASYISLYDGYSWIKQFENTNPNFNLKRALVLQDAAPTVYNMQSALNSDGSEGEYFKIMPSTLENLYHHLTQRALSQLPLLTDISIASNNRKIQITSKRLGSNGAIEVIGGNANNIDLPIFSQGQLVLGEETNEEFMRVTVRAFPITLTSGDLVKVKNKKAAKRLSRLNKDDSIDVEVDGSGVAKYIWNYKNTRLSELVRITTEDVSSVHGRPSGTVWRWYHNDGGSFCNITDQEVGQPAQFVGAFSADGLTNAQNIYTNVLNTGGSDSYYNFTITVGNTPNQGDYITFENVTGDSFAVWISLDGNTTEPTGSTYSTATHKIRVDVLSSDTEEQAVFKILTELNDSISFLSIFSIFQEEGANFNDVAAGDLLNVYGSFSGWPSGNLSYESGEEKYAGFPIVDVNAEERWIDVVNPKGTAMSNKVIGASGSVGVVPTPVIKWNLKHLAKNTRYRIRSIGFNNLYKLEWVDGAEPGFIDCGVAVDDLMLIKGSTFSNFNTGYFRVLGADNKSIIFENTAGSEELNTIIDFNNSDIPVNWTSSLDILTGPVGAFKNVYVGNWVKKLEDAEELYRQVIKLEDDNGTNVSAFPALATKVILAANYNGSSSSSVGVRFDQTNDVNKGALLQDVNDIQFFEGDSTIGGDSLFVDLSADDTWFSTANSGTFEIKQVGTDNMLRPYVEVENTVGRSETDRMVGNNLLGFYIIEGNRSIYESIRQISHTAISSNNAERRDIYLTPANKIDKISRDNETYITPIGKIGYSNEVITGVDGYKYYTGLLRTVQRIIDGYEPEPTKYPGRRAIGGTVEILPPLIRRVVVALEVTTNEGVNLNEISSEIKTAVINYVDGLGVGEDVILSEIVVSIMKITGVAAVTFTNPAPSTERVSLADNEKAFIEPDDISIA